MSILSQDQQRRTLQYMFRVSLGVIVFHAAAAIVVIWIIMGDLLLALTFVASLAFIAIVGLIVYRKLARRVAEHKQGMGAK